MLFIEAISRANTQSSDKKSLIRTATRSIKSNKDSVDLSSAAHQVKEIHLDSYTKQPLTASTSIFANLIEHVLSHVMGSKLHLHSPEELDLDSKDWRVFLQIPPMDTEKSKTNAAYATPEPSRRPAKQLIFHIPVKPSYDIPVEMTLLLSPHNGSPETLEMFHTFPKESWLPVLNTPYPPDFLNQQPTHHHILLDQDGESDQLSPLYAHINQSQLTTTESDISPKVFGLRIWRAKNNRLSPVALGDNKIGLLFVGDYKPLDNSFIDDDEKSRQASNLHIQA